MVPDVWKPGQAKQIKAGTDFIIQMHYTSSGKDTKDQTSIGLVYAKEPPKERIVTTAPRVQQPLHDSRGRSGHFRAEAIIPVVNPMTVINIFPHLHLRGLRFNTI